MEILFPAGCLEYVIAAKESGANAVYGGLKLYNARNKAVNFAVDEIKEAIQICHENNMKFYMTLNTLMFDDEINEVIKTLKDENIVPDAFICADIGLMQTLKDEFPNIPLHASTQFGIHSIEDAQFMKDYGVERVILSRELTREEIKAIMDNVDTEVEIFVWGSQCISFSGSCFLGSFVNGGTANRGKCITLCRDKYSANNKNGNFLYVPDLNAIKETDLNVDSLKLEGRRRNTEELKTIVNSIKDKSLAEKSNGYFISKNVDENGLFEFVNTRQKKLFIHSDDVKVNSEDVWVEEINGLLEYVNQPTNNSYYVYSEIKKTFLPEKFNISMEMTVKNDIVIKIMLLNHKGEAKYFDKLLNDNDTVAFSSEEIYKFLNIFKDVNLYSIKYKKEYEGQVVKITRTMLNELKSFIENVYTKNTIEINIESDALSKVYTETDNIILAKELLGSGYPVIFNISSVNQINSINVEDLSGDIIYKLPFFNFDNQNLMEKIEKFSGKKIMLTKFAQLKYIQEGKFEKVYADYIVPVWNKKSIEYLKQNNCDRFSASPELSIEKNKELFSSEKEVIFTVGGRPACVYTRQCFKKVYGCNGCTFNSKDIKNQDRCLNMKVKCYPNHREMYYMEAMLNAYCDMPDNAVYRYVSRDETIDELKQIIDTLKTDNYYKKLKETEKFKNSYSNLLMEDKRVEN